MNIFVETENTAVPPAPDEGTNGAPLSGGTPEKA